VVIERDLHVGGRRLLSSHHRIDKLAERQIVAPLVIGELSLLLFWSRFLVLCILVLCKCRNRS
jgi:hypothetical protein